MTKQQSTEYDHIQRVNKVLNFIQDNLNRPMDLEKLSSIACFSSFHFHRIFTAYLGESLNSYVRRLRLEKSAEKLCHTDISITDLAFMSGYETPSSYTKAFTQHFGEAPSSFRKGKKTLRLQKMEFSIQDQKGDIQLDHTIVNREETKVIYVRKVGAYEQGAKDAWDTLCNFAFPKQLVNDKAEFIGISYDNPEITDLDKLRYDACITVTNEVTPENDIGVQTIPGGKYAVFTHKGSYTGLQQTYTDIFSQWYPKSGIELRDAPCMEKYLNHPDETPEDELLTEIFVPVG